MEKASADPVKMLQKELEGLKSKIADARMENEEMIGLQGEYLSALMHYMHSSYTLYLQIHTAVSMSNGLLLWYLVGRFCYGLSRLCELLITIQFSSFILKVSVAPVAH